MVNLGILALVGLGAFFLFRKGSFAEGGPAIPQSVLQGQLLQAQFDVLGETLEDQNTALQEAQRLLNFRFNQQPRTTSTNPLLGASLGPPTQTQGGAGRDIIVATFGKVPSNFRQGPTRPRRNEVCTNPNACL